MFYKQFNSQPEVIINPDEHKIYTRKTPIEALKLDLIKDLDECIKLFYDIK